MIASTDRYGLHVTRRGKKITACFDMDDSLELSDNFIWLFRAMEDSWKESDASIIGRSGRDFVNTLIISAIDLFLFDKNQDKRIANAEQFSHELQAFVYEIATSDSYKNARHVPPSWLREARKHLGLTQSQLATALKLGNDGKRAIGRWEAGDRPISGPVEVAVSLMLILTTQENGPAAAMTTGPIPVTATARRADRTLRTRAAASS